MGSGVPVASRDECVVIDTTADGRVRFTRDGATTYMRPATVLLFAESFDAKGDEESRCIAAALRRAVARIGGGNHGALDGEWHAWLAAKGVNCG